MAIELLIKHGDEAAAQKDFLGAISKYTQALKENPETFTALIKRAQTYVKLCNYDQAKADISKAFAVAEKRGKRADIATCHFKLGLTNYAEKDFDGALVNFRKAKEYQSPEPALEIWLSKASRDVEKSKTEKTADTKEPQPGKAEKVEDKPTSFETINKQAPLKVKIRDDWYQDNERVIVTIYAKNVKNEQVSAEFGARLVALSFPSADSSEYHYNLEPLYGPIEPSKSSYRVYATKVEVTLSKQTPGKWASLEGDGTSDSAPAQASSGGLAYPSSAKKAVDWSNFNVKDDEEESVDFFAKLYKDVDEDTRRAMMKSYVESNGTVLTTNWDEAKSKTFDTTPPEGLEAKKW